MFILRTIPAALGGSKASLAPRSASNDPMAHKMSIFDEQYRVVAIEGDRLLIRGVQTGNVLSIVNPEPLAATEFPPGKLIALTDPSASRSN